MESEANGPQIGQWYVRNDNGAMFQITGIDETAGSIEIQYFDGDIDEIEAQDWPQMMLEPTEAPEDCSGALDDVEREDLGYSETAIAPHERPAAFESLRSTTESVEDAAEPDERD